MTVEGWSKIGRNIAFQTISHKLKITIGWYETYDVATGGDRFHAEGVLETRHDENGNVYLTGFDGCFELPDFILERLVEKGIIDEL